MKKNDSFEDKYPNFKFVKKYPTKWAKFELFSDGVMFALAKVDFNEKKGKRIENRGIYIITDSEEKCEKYLKEIKQL